jgi:hypothetical protein
MRLTNSKIDQMNRAVRKPNLLLLGKGEVRNLASGAEKPFETKSRLLTTEC